MDTALKKYSRPPPADVGPHPLHGKEYFEETCGFQCFGAKYYASNYKYLTQELASQLGYFDLGNGTDNRFDWPLCNQTTTGVGKPVLCQSGVVFSVHDDIGKRVYGESFFFIANPIKMSLHYQTTARSSCAAASPSASRSSSCSIRSTRPCTSFGTTTRRTGTCSAPEGICQVQAD